MGKISKILVCGHAGVGKTAVIEQLIYGNHAIGTVSHIHVYMYTLCLISFYNACLGTYIEKRRKLSVGYFAIYYI